MSARVTWLLAVLLVGACGGKEPKVAGTNAAPPTEPGSASAEPVTLVVAYGSEKKSWLEEEAQAFERSGALTRSGRPIRVETQAMGSGEATQAILSGKLRPHVFSPASGVYVTLLNQAWLSVDGHTKPLAPAGEPLVLSPIVIAMWKPMAEALGWPDKRIAWADLLRVNADPRGWGALEHPEWGRFKLGHTHPDFSNSGVLSVLAEAYAGAKKTRGLSTADLDAPETGKFVAAVEETIVHYGKSTGFFADKMVERGPTYLSAAVLYENLVIESYAKAPAMPLVAIYPVEGTFWSDHPYSVLDAPWVTPDEREAADAFLAFLKARPAQERALELGFRPSDPAIATTAPIDAAHGVDPKQPSTLLEVPDAPVLTTLLELWRENKKPADVILVFDKSGSMEGEPMAQAKAGAKAFLETLHDRDQVTLELFDGYVYPAIGPVALGPARTDLGHRIDQTLAAGGTALYDAVATAYAAARERAQTQPDRIHAVVVMTDGRDESSRAVTLATLNERLGASGEEAPVRVFTISYGQNADTSILGRIAEAAKGATASGDVKTIVSVFQDMGSFL